MIYNLQVDELSGGFRMKTNLICGIINQPHILLIDEPTNFLDLDSVLWLEKKLMELKHDMAIIITSHDTFFK